MRRIRTLLVVISLLTLAAAACAGEDAKPATPPRSSADVVAVTASPAVVAARAGAPVTFEIKVEIAKPWHLYAHSYVEDPESLYIGIDVQPGEGFALRDLKVAYPEAKKGTFLGEEVLMHEGALTLKVTATVPPGAKGDLAAPLSLTVQACDDKVCLRPADVPVTVKVTAS